MRVEDIIRRRLGAALSPRFLEVTDNSARHRGHAGWREGGQTHFQLHIVADEFTGLGRLQRQRLVHRILAAELAGPVHALEISALAPGEDGAG